MNENELMKAAAEEVVYSNTYYGKCLLTFWEGKFPRNAEGKPSGRPVRWVEGDDPKDRIIMIDFLLDLLPGSSANFQVKQSWMKHDKDWQRIVIPSLKEIGVVDDSGAVDFSQVKDHYVKVQQVEGTRPRDKNNPDKGNWNTYKFLAIYKSQEEAAAAMALDSGDMPIPSETPAPKKATKNDQRKAAALEFVKVALKSMEGLKPDEIKTSLGQFIESNPNIKPYLSIDDPEVMELINNVSIPF